MIDRCMDFKQYEKAHDNKDIATAFQFGMAFGFAKKYDELSIVMDYYLNCVLDKIRAEIEQTTSRYCLSKERFALGQVEWSDRLIKESEVLEIIDKYIAKSKE